MVRAVFPGTFDPIHYGHIDIARRASTLFDEIIVAVYDKPLKTLLFSPEERMQLTRDAFANDKKIVVTGYSGLTIQFCRDVNAKVMVRGLRVFSDFEHEFRIALANKRLAPDIEIVALITNQDHMFISSTTVREVASLGGDISSMVPPQVEMALKKRYSETVEGQSPFPMTSLRD